MNPFLIFLLSLALLLPHLNAKAPQPTCKDVGTIDKSLNLHINRHLKSLLARSTFLSVFKVALDNPCPFWQSNSQCMMRECTVCNCPEKDVPSAWRADPPSSNPGCPQPQETPPSNPLNNVDRSLTALGDLVRPPIWQTTDTHVWTVQEDDSTMMYVDLRKNPERFTGYAGESSLRVWRAIYLENCFSFSEGCRTGVCAPETCKEERVLYRLISGIHSSISMHIANMYLNGNLWTSNVQIYRDRVRNHPGRIDNLHVAYAVVMRAVSKAAATLHPHNYSYVTGNDDNDRYTRRGMADLLEMPMLQPGCEHRVFDESDMFLTNSEKLLPEFRSAFRNISMIMDCVGCEKCRLWGKLQFLGLGTALRILFEDTPDLQRNEVIALVNLFYKLSSSVMWVDEMERIVTSDARVMGKVGVLIGVMGILLLSVCLRKDGGRKRAVSKDVGRETDGKVVNEGEKSEVSTISSADVSTDKRKEETSTSRKEETSPVLTPRRSKRLQKRKPTVL